MEKAGLIVEPNWDEPEKYLSQGELTKLTDKVKKEIENIDSNAIDEEKVINIMRWMNKTTQRESNSRDPKKFNKSAEEILEAKLRTGCSDSAVLYSTVARALGIPTMQIQSLDIDWAKKVKNNEEIDGLYGHFYCASYLETMPGKFKWYLIDTDMPQRRVMDENYNPLMEFNINDRNIDKNRYAYAYTIDSKEIEIDRQKMDSIERNGRVMFKVIEEANFKDMKIDLNEQTR